jgi:hypothetical protein
MGLSSRCLSLHSCADHQPTLPLPEAIHLVELSERIKHQTRVKRLEREKEIKERHLRSLGEQMTMGLEGGAVEMKSNARKNYQEYFQTRQQAAVMIDEYLDMQDHLRHQQVRSPPFFHPHLPSFLPSFL